MKLTLLTMTLAAQLLASSALAQTPDTAAETSSQSNAPDLEPVAYGDDWPETLVMAMLTEDQQEVRPEEDLAMQWAALAPADQQIIRRDCADVSDLTDPETLSDEQDNRSGAGEATGDTSVTPFTSDAAPEDDAPAMDSADQMMSEDDTQREIAVSIAQMEEICTAVQDL